MGKAIANGLPLSAVGASRDLFGKWPRGSHGSTYGGNAVACAAAVEVVDVISGLVVQVPALGEHAMSQLRKINDSHPTVGDVRGLGLMIAIELTDDEGQPDSGSLEFVRKHVLEAGLIFHPCGPAHNIVRFIPPLVVTVAELDEAVGMIDDALTAWEASR